MALTVPVLSVPRAVREHWRAWSVLGVMLALYLVAGMSLAVPGAGQLQITRASAMVPIVGGVPLQQAAPATAATHLKQIAPSDALAWNAAIPIAGGPNPAARPFLLAVASSADRARSLDCLTAAIYYEAATEPLDGQRAVAQVVLNRVRHPAYPNSVCGVVFEGSRRSTGCQFSFTCDGSLRRAPMASYWERARQVAEAALSGYVYSPVGWATHYHTNWVVPYWASSLTKAANVGTHIFYRWAGGWGRAPAFVNRYAGVEPAIAWRGGFGQPTREERLAVEARDAAAAEAALLAAGEPGAPGAAPTGSVDSFQRAVLRRYEPLRRDSANAMISERARADRSLTTSQRWALTGDNSTSTQAPLGRAPAPAPAPAADPAPPLPAPAPTATGR